MVAAYKQEVGPGEQSLLIAWAGFAVTFGVTRAVTHLLRRMSGGGGMSAGGRHLHHYNLGIALLGGVGGVALQGAEKHRRHPVTAAAYGAGAALIVDEFALLFDLQDVYWAKDGRRSVDAAVALIAGGGTYLVSIPFWHGAARELLGRRHRN